MNMTTGTENVTWRTKLQQKLKSLNTFVGKTSQMANFYWIFWVKLYLNLTDCPFLLREHIYVKLNSNIYFSLDEQARPVSITHTVGSNFLRHYGPTNIFLCSIHVFYLQSSINRFQECSPSNLPINAQEYN